MRTFLVTGLIALLGATLTPAVQAAVIEGGPSTDVLHGTNEDDSIYGRGSYDALFGKSGDDKLWGGSGYDWLFLGPGTDVGRGEGGSDIIIDEDGDRGDRLFGGSGDDRLWSRDNSPDKLDCGDGTGDIAFADGADDVRNCETVHVSSQPGVILGSKADQTLQGTAVGEHILAAGGNDVVYGGDGDDTIGGGPGKNRLFGGAGSDIFYDDNGRSDTMRGGAAYDTFYSGDGAADTIDCGPDGGLAYADEVDNVSGCTYVLRG